MKLARYEIPNYYKDLKLKPDATQEEFDALKAEHDKRIYEDDSKFQKAFSLLGTPEGREWYETRKAFCPKLKPLYSRQELVGWSEFVGKAIWAVLLVFMLWLMAGFIPHYFYFDNFMFFLIDTIVSTLIACMLATFFIDLRDKFFAPKFEALEQHNLAVDYENDKIYKNNFDDSFKKFKEYAVLKQYTPKKSK